MVQFILVLLSLKKTTDWRRKSYSEKAYTEFRDKGINESLSLFLRRQDQSSYARDFLLKYHLFEPHLFESNLTSEWRLTDTVESLVLKKCMTTKFHPGF
jgi:hypothetical protein